MQIRQKPKTRRGYAMVTTFGILTLVAVAGVSYVNSATQTVRISKRQTEEVQLTHVCEAGVQSVLRSLWRPFKIDQNFFDLDEWCTGASSGNAAVVTSGAMPSIGVFSAGVIGYTSPNNDPYSRIVTVRAVGFIDRNGNGQLDGAETSKVVDVSARFELARSQVFDYTYFINNYGWMDGFAANQLIVNGDMRANGNFDFLNGSPTVNGSVIACNNDKLDPGAPGNINMAPVKQTTSSYISSFNNSARVRPGYDPTRHGAVGSTSFEQNRDFVFESAGSLQTNRAFGAAMMDARGVRAWNRVNTSDAPTVTTLDTSPTQEVVMPDLSDLPYYQGLSGNYRNPKQNWQDGTPNPNYNQVAYIEVWDPTLNSGNGAYKRLTTNGVIDGSAVLVGTTTNPIRIHGPVTVTQDVVMKGVVEGQGTIYTGRNVHVVGNITYKNAPDFRFTGGRNSMQAVENYNEKRDFLGLAARGSVILGNPLTFTDTYPLYYMMPPFTKGRYDENGNYIPAYNAKNRDSTGRMLYQSVVPDATLRSVATDSQGRDIGVNTVDAILYTNFVGGGNVGTAGGGMTLNGTIISKDEAIVAWSLPVRLNYDNRIRERSISRTPLIDLQLPRSPVMLRSTWQDRGFRYQRGAQ